MRVGVADLGHAGPLMQRLLAARPSWSEVSVRPASGGDLEGPEPLGPRLSGYPLRVLVPFQAICFWYRLWAR